MLYRPLILILLFTTLANICFAQRFTITGNIPGTKNGALVTLFSRDGYQHEQLASTKINNGKFALTGAIKTPTFCMITIKDSTKRDNQKDISLIVENTLISLNTDNYDSLPGYFETISKEKNIRIKGGSQQAHYQEYRDYMHTIDSTYDYFNRLYIDYRYSRRQGVRVEDSAKLLSVVSDSLKTLVQQQKTRFIQSHPTYWISSYVLNDDIKKDFYYNAKELDSISNRFGNSEDPKRNNELKLSIQELRKKLKYSSFKTFDVLSSKGDTVNIASFFEKGKYTLIDFWASWCGPCRAAIPELKILETQQSSTLNLISVSLDESKKNWEVAVKEEAAPWTQLWMPKNLYDKIKETYPIHFIPYMFLINPKGEIIFGGSDLKELQKELL